MKRLACFATGILLAALAGAQSAVFPAFRPRDARSVAVADVFRSVSSGTDSFFGNPAGYIGADRDILVFGAQSWAYARGSEALVGMLPKALDGGTMSAPGDDFRGFGLGFKLGAGYAGRGVGLGLFVGRDSYTARDDSEESTADAIFCGVFGAAIPVDVPLGKLRFGADIRPFYRLRGATDPAAVDAFAASGGDYDDLLGGTRALSGVGVALNAGLIWDVDDAFAVGFMARDISPSFPVVESTVDERLGSLFGAEDGDFPKAGTALLEPDIALGVSWRPVPAGALRDRVDPRVGAEFGELYALVTGAGGFFDSLSVGAEVTLAKTLALRAGLNGGRPSFGVGLRLLALDLDAAVFSLSQGGDERAGLAVRANVRLQ